MKAITLKIRLSGEEFQYKSLAIQDDDRYYYCIGSTVIEIKKWEHERIIANPHLYYFSTALKLHYRIKNLNKLLNKKLVNPGSFTLTPK